MDAASTARRPTLLREADVILRDGRNLAYAEWGRADGVPVVLLHGTPDSHVFSPDNYPVDATSADARVRLITVSRPGYSRSTPQAGRTLLGWAGDVAQLADELRLERFGLVGLSGGVPFALACGVALAERLTCLGVVSGGGPLDEVPGEWDSLDPVSREHVMLAREQPERAVESLAEASRWLAENPEAILDTEGWPEVDRWMVEEPTLREIVLQETREAGRGGVLGRVWDVMCFNRPWGFTPRDIPVPTYVWHGEADAIASPRHFVYLALAIKGARARLWRGEGHTALLRGPRWPEVLGAMKQPS